MIIPLEGSLDLETTYLGSDVVQNGPKPEHCRHRVLARSRALELAMLGCWGAEYAAIVPGRRAVRHRAQHWHSLALKTYVHTKPSAWMLTAALFTIAETSRNHEGPQKVRDTFTVVCPVLEYDAALQRNEPSGHAKTWRTHKCICLRDRSQREKATHHVTPTI